MKKKMKSARKHVSTSRTHATKSKVSSASSGFTLKRFYYFLGFTVIVLTLASQVTYTQSFAGSNVLGDENSQSGGGSNGGSSASQESIQQQQELQKQQQEAQQHAAEQTAQQQGQESQGTQVNIQKNETEVQTATGVKIKTKVEDNGAQKIEAETPGVHFKFEGQSGELKLEAVNDKGEKLSSQDAEIKHLETDLAGKDIKVSSADGVMEVERNGVRARTNFPLSINQATHELTVTTPEGVKTVAVLPDDAIANLLNNGFLTTINPGLQDQTGASSSGGIQSIQIALHDGQSVYEIQGEKKGKLLGIVPVSSPRTVLVSTANGQVVALTQSWLSRLISFLTF